MMDRVEERFEESFGISANNGDGAIASKSYPRNHCGVNLLGKIQAKFRRHIVMDPGPVRGPTVGHARLRVRTWAAWAAKRVYRDYRQPRR